MVANTASQPFDELYDYDQVHRLKSMERGTLNAGKDTITSKQFEQCWSLDSTGNWDKFLEDTNGNSTWNLEQSRTTNVVNEITNITETAGSSWANPAYNANGNMTSIPKPSDLTGSYTATWDAWNRLAKLVDGANTVAVYEYDGINRRDVKEVYTSGTLSETRHVYFSNDWQVLEERVDAATTADQQFIWGTSFVDDLVLRETTSETLYALQDANWNVTALSDTTGSIKERFSYQPFGESTELDPDFTTYTGTGYAWQTRFTGRELDLDTGLNLHRNRYLHLQLGSWVSRDSIGYADGYSLYGAYFVPHSVDPTGFAADSSCSSDENEDGPKKVKIKPCVKFTCPEICAAYIRGAKKLGKAKELLANYGGVICYDSVKCSCVWGDYGPIKIFAPGDCPLLDRIIMDHENRHHPEVNCPDPKDRVKSCGMKPGVFKPGIDPNTAECKHRKIDFKKFRAAIKKSKNPKCKLIMENFLEAVEEWVADNCP